MASKSPQAKSVAYKSHSIIAFFQSTEPSILLKDHYQSFTEGIPSTIKGKALSDLGQSWFAK